MTASEYAAHEHRAHEDAGEFQTFLTEIHMNSSLFSPLQFSYCDELIIVYSFTLVNTFVLKKRTNWPILFFSNELLAFFITSCIVAVEFIIRKFTAETYRFTLLLYTKNAAEAAFFHVFLLFHETQISL